MYMKKFWDNITSFSPIYLFWLVTVLVVGFWSIKYLPFNPTFPYYGDLSTHYTRYLASFAHFDGIHYLRLIAHGYDDTGSQAFFPIYPLLVRFLTFSVFDPLYIAIGLNLILTLISLSVVLNSQTLITKQRFLWLFLSFPASFYLLANYTESLFIFLVVIFFALLKKQSWLYAAIIAGLASGTRLAGVFLSLSLVIELIRARKSYLQVGMFMMVSLLGLFSYLVYLTSQFGDPLMFIHVQSMFGSGRSSGTIILLPQVIFRYLKIMVQNTPNSIAYFRALVELGYFFASLILLYIYRKKFLLSKFVFCLFLILLPSLSGTLSSFPRYLLPAIPLFLVLAKNLSRGLFLSAVIFQYAILIIAVALFVQGIFIA